jgi:hypothetical protein
MKMSKMIKLLLITSLLTVFCGTGTKANTRNAASCNTSDVQAAINTAAGGDTVTIPAGTCTWTSGVVVSGKGIYVQGVGGGRIIAYSSSALTLGTGNRTLAILGTGVTGTPPKNLTPNISNGQTLHIAETGSRQNFMDGTVTSFSGGVLTVNITRFGGTCSIQGGSGGLSPQNCKRWMISTVPSTVIINNSATAPLFAITEDTSVHTTISGIKIAHGSSTANGTFTFYNGGNSGQAIIVHDIWVEQANACSSDCNTFQVNTNRGLVYNSSFDQSPGPASNGQGQVPQVFHLQPFDETSWAQTGFWGILDSTGQHNFYAESNDYHAYLNIADNAEGARSVFRYSVMDNAGLGTHGVDTGVIGSRYFEYYNNVGVFEGYDDGSTFNLNWWFFLRGGSFVVHDNVLPALQSTDYGTKGDFVMTEMALNRNAGPVPCYAYNTSNGAGYPAPRQVGMGRVTGTGHDGFGNLTYSTGIFGSSTPEYVGDPEPAYIWNNSRSPMNVVLTDYAGPANVCTGGSADSTSNYIKANRDYFNGSAAKPGYTPYTYPHPLTQGSGSGNNVAAPTNLSAVVQ